MKNVEVCTKNVEFWSKNVEYVENVEVTSAGGTLVREIHQPRISLSHLSRTAGAYLAFEDGRGRVVLKGKSISGNSGAKNFGKLGFKHCFCHFQSI